MKVAVLGSGSWGTALAKVLNDNQQQVVMWGPDKDTAHEINTEHTNHVYLPAVTLDPNIHATTDMKEAVEGAEIVLLVVPTKAMREVLKQLRSVLEELNNQPIIVHASKGIEHHSYLRISQIIEEELPTTLYKGIAVLSGPSHAEEVVRDEPTAVVVASLQEEIALEVQEAFMTPAFRVYTSPDLVGVELGGALKNIIAIGSGILDGLGYGDNPRAGLMTRGLAEIKRIGEVLGADPLTFSGLSGMGDLIVTCTSPHSRNFRAGRLLAQGLSREEVEKEINMVVEGILTTESVYHWSKALGVEMPITQGLYNLIYNDEVSVEEGLNALMTRESKAEWPSSDNKQKEEQ